MSRGRNTETEMGEFRKRRKRRVFFACTVMKRRDRRI